MRQIVIVILLLISSSIIWACDMFALILAPGENFSDHEETVYEYFNFLIGRSSANLNDDGYGIIAYRRDSKLLSEDDVWYKTGYGTWFGDGLPDPLVDAREVILSEESDYYLVIAHVRQATGGSGSHPFRINAALSTYSLCHNGVISLALRQAMMEFLGEAWFQMYPSNWFGEYGDTGSFIDSELYTHYLVKYVIDNDHQTRKGIISAMQENNLVGIDAADYLLNAGCTANMLFSDGEALFAFRNTKSISSQKLSWKDYNGIIGIRTQAALENELEQNELIRFAENGEMDTVILEYIEEEEFVPAAIFYAQPNPFKDEVDIYYVAQRADDQNVDEVSKPDKIIIYDLRGRKIRELDNSLEINGYRAYHWDGRAKDGKQQSSGIYFYHHNISGKTGKVIYLK